MSDRINSAEQQPRPLGRSLQLAYSGLRHGVEAVKEMTLMFGYPISRRDHDARALSFAMRGLFIGRREEVDELTFSYGYDGFFHSTGQAVIRRTGDQPNEITAEMRDYARISAYGSPLDEPMAERTVTVLSLAISDFWTKPEGPVYFEAHAEQQHHFYGGPENVTPVCLVNLVNSGDKLAREHREPLTSERVLSRREAVGYERFFIDPTTVQPFIN